VSDDRTTRFIPVDMKDRLKTVFNRSSRRTPVEDDVPDYNAIFSANKKPDPKKAARRGTAARTRRRN